MSLVVVADVAPGILDTEIAVVVVAVVDVIVGIVGMIVAVVVVVVVDVVVVRVLVAVVVAAAAGDAVVKIVIVIANALKDHQLVQILHESLLLHCLKGKMNFYRILIDNFHIFNFFSSL